MDTPALTPYGQAVRIAAILSGRSISQDKDVQSHLLNIYLELVSTLVASGWPQKPPQAIARREEVLEKWIQGWIIRHQGVGSFVGYAP